MSEVSKCEIPDCGVQLDGSSVFERLYKRRICRRCFENIWQEAKNSGYGEFFEANYDRKDYSEDFWRSVGAFIDLSRTGPNLRG